MARMDIPPQDMATRHTGLMAPHGHPMAAQPMDLMDIQFLGMATRCMAATELRLLATATAGTSVTNINEQRTY